MEIRAVGDGRKAYLDLLLLADEQEDMIDRYLERGEMYILWQDGARAECVVTDEGGGVLELKSLAVAPGFQRRGYGKRLIAFLEERYAGAFSVLRVGTGESPLTLPFYRKCGFAECGRVPDFFTEHYRHPIVEGGVLLRDMVYLEKAISKGRQVSVAKFGEI